MARSVISINTGWWFRRGDDDRAMLSGAIHEHWQRVDLPHTWNAVDGAEGPDYYRGPCWYRKEFYLGPEARGRRVFIECQGANTVATVYLNERHVGEHRGGYSTFRFDLTDHLDSSGENLLAIRVDNSPLGDVYPQMADFTFFGGLYRDVQLVVVDPVHFDLLDHGSKGIYIYQDAVDDSHARLRVRARVVNEHREAATVTVYAELRDADERPVAHAGQELVLSQGELREVWLAFELAHPHLWQGREDPYLYRARLSITSYNDTLDEVEVAFGLRTCQFDPDRGFFLNGRPLRLRGVARHQDRAGKGWAISPEDELEDLEIIKDMGANAVRLAHYQHSQSFYELCDREGLLVWAEVPVISALAPLDLDGANAKQQLVELIRQNFNHPSIICWGVQNEIQIGGDKPEARQLVQELHALAKREDPTRPTAAANVMFLDVRDEYNHITDLVGYNLYYGWYTGRVEDMSEWIDRFRAANPKVPLSISEYGAEGIVRYHSSDPRPGDYSEDYQALYHERAWSILEERPYLWATYVWNMFDFASAMRDEGGVRGRNNKGLVTYDRKIRKDAFYFYKAQWSEEPFVYIAGRRYLERSEERTAVKIYSNCQQVSLEVNGQPCDLVRERPGVFVCPAVELQPGGNVLRSVGTSPKATVSDTIVLYRVTSQNPSYVAPPRKGFEVPNWFELPEDEGEPLSEDAGGYSLHSTMRELLDDERSREVLYRYLGKLDEHPSFSMVLDMPLETVLALAPSRIDDRLLRALAKDLSRIRRC